MGRYLQIPPHYLTIICIVKVKGFCKFCGTGICCRKGYHETKYGCDKTIGGLNHHECVMPSNIERASNWF